ncbi:homoserine kinase [Candidatus Liberibacter africanus]|uniref:Homoserine kinase n=1 Tax=Candidatus Liberibacter africanus PTSAPSY TaxID=1277257 RepID=A0A0G3I2M0_LIBAF|nr:homoserine kinase [Candidatus Liberibacter africanus]AKK20136.1 homoserine kinase [Candidatus Liberibacter africanus PTSAPSY]QTP63940.1 homoserine kinase [Candidatus Liberibacter africanus]
MAVYTHPPQKEIKRFIKEYAIGQLSSIKPILHGIDNSNFIIHTSVGTYILTIYEKRINEKDLPFFIELLKYISRNKLPCPLPIPRNDGKIYGFLSNKPANIFSFIKGNTLTHISETHCEEVGSMLACMHQKTKDFHLYRKNNLSLPDFKVLWEKCSPKVDKDLKKEIDHELYFLKESWPHNLPTGIIHADLFPDNVLFYKNKIMGLIDFYFSCYDSFMYDLSVCINAWCFNENNTYNPSRGFSFLNGYNKIRNISENELQSLPTLLRGAALRFFLTRLYDSQNMPFNALVITKDPMEYVRKIRFHKKMSSISQYGL